MLMSHPLPSRANEHLAMGKLKLNVAVGLLTSHTTLRAHMFKHRLALWQDCWLRGQKWW